MKGHRRRETASLLAALTDGVVSRDLLQSVGISPADVRTEIAAGRWRRHGRQTVAVHTGPLGVEAERWRVVWETGSTISALDGVTALQVAGLRHFSDDDIHLSVVHTCAIRRTPGARLHKVIRRLPDELVDSSLPRTRAPVAALRAAYWAASDRQAALVLLMAVQQRLTTPEQLLGVVRSAAGPQASRLHPTRAARHRLRGRVARRARLRPTVSVPVGCRSRSVRWCGRAGEVASTSTCAGGPVSSSRSTGSSTGRASP